MFFIVWISKNAKKFMKIFLLEKFYDVFFMREVKNKSFFYITIKVSNNFLTGFLNKTPQLLMRLSISNRINIVIIVINFRLASHKNHPCNYLILIVYSSRLSEMSTHNILKLQRHSAAFRGLSLYYCCVWRLNVSK